MRIFFFGNNRLGSRIAEWLVSEGYPIVGACLHPAESRKSGDSLEMALSGVPIYCATSLEQPCTVQAIVDLKPSIGLSVLFGYVLQPVLLRVFEKGCLNLHPSLLPYNRGSFPNVWSIVDGTPAGVTIHYMDQSIDTGDIVAQVPVSVEPVDTGHSLYQKLETVAFDLFRQTWPKLVSGTAPRVPQPAGAAPRRKRDVLAVDRIDLDRTYTARELINILRARTFPPYDGAYFEQEGRRVYLDLHLRYGA